MRRDCSLYASFFLSWKFLQAHPRTNLNLSDLYVALANTSIICFIGTFANIIYVLITFFEISLRS